MSRALAVPLWKKISVILATCQTPVHLYCFGVLNEDAVWYFWCSIHKSFNGVCKTEIMILPYLAVFVRSDCVKDCKPLCCPWTGALHKCKYPVCTSWKTNLMEFYFEWCELAELLGKCAESLGTGAHCSSVTYSQECFCAKFRLSVQLSWLTSTFELPC